MKKSLLLSITAVLAFANIYVVSDSDKEHIQPAVDLWNKTHKDKVIIKYIDEDLPLTAAIKNGKYDLVVSENLDKVVACKKENLLERNNELAKFIKSQNFTNKNNLIDPDNQWFAYTYRIRAFYVKKGSKIDPKTYEELQKSFYKNKICIRSYYNHYNIDLFINLKNIWGDKYFNKWITGFTNNVKYKPQGNDRYQVKLVSEGKCDIAIANSHYRGAMLENLIQKEWAEKTKVIIPNQGKDKLGAVAMYSSVALIKKKPFTIFGIKLSDPEYNSDAKKFMKFLYTAEAQKAISNEAYVFALKSEWTTKFTKEILKENNLTQDQMKIVPNPKNSLIDERPWAYDIAKKYMQILDKK